MTREEAINALRCLITMPGFTANEALDVAIAALKEQSNADQRVTNTENVLGGWVRVKDKLPTVEDANPNESVLAILKEDGFAKSWWYDIVVRHPKEFTHWMPMPEPPEVEV